MRYSEILEACWKGYKQAGLKKKGGRQVPNCVPVQEAADIFLDNAARDMMAVLSMMAVGFGYGIYVKIRNKLDRYQGYQIVAALEDKGVTMNRATYEKVKPVLDQFKQALKNDDGAQAKELAKRIEQMVVMGKLAAPEPQVADTAVTAKERELEEDLKKWFKEKWVRFGPDGKIRGDCARGSSKEGKPKCLPQAKAQALGKKGRASSAAKKRREDPDPERRGPAKNVATKVREEELNEKQDACYNKVKSRYKVWPSAYASGALVRCRKVGAKNWGNKSKK
jgi:hypothetical protein